MKQKLHPFFLSLVVLGSHANAQSIANPSFESETFGTNPGYISGALNGPITGWTASNDSRVGLNPSPGTAFANNGTIPEGSNVAFIQGDAGGTTTLTSTDGITGLTPGNTYNLTFRLNNRVVVGGNDPEWGLVIDGTTVLRNRVNGVGGTNPYKYVSYNFVATGTTMPLAIDNYSLADKTILVDDFTVTEVTPKITVSPWTDDASTGIDSSLTYTHAYNLGNTVEGGPVVIFVNEVEFTGVVGGNPAVPGSFSYTMPIRTDDAGNNVTGDGATLANDFVFGNGSPTLTLEGLTPGASYRTSIFTVGFDASGDGRAATITSPEGERLTVDVNIYGNDNGARVDIEFTATAATQSILVPAVFGSNSFHTYAFANALLSAPAEIVVDSITTAAGTNSGKKVTLDFTAPGLVDVYASDDLVIWTKIASDVAASPYIEDDVPATRRFYVLVTAGATYPPVP